MSDVDIIYVCLMCVSDVDIYVSDMDIIYVYQIWMFMYARCGYYLYVSDVIYVCKMWILFMCVRYGSYWCVSDMDIIHVCRMWIVFMCIRC